MVVKCNFHVNIMERSISKSHKTKVRINYLQTEYGYIDAYIVDNGAIYAIVVTKSEIKPCRLYELSPINNGKAQ